MDPESKKLRKLEAYVQYLEAENQALRAELNKGNAQTIDFRLEEAGAKEAFQSDGFTNQGNEQQEITQPVANP